MYFQKMLYNALQYYILQNMCNDCEKQLLSNYSEIVQPNAFKCCLKYLKISLSLSENFNTLEKPNWKYTVKLMFDS